MIAGSVARRYAKALVEVAPADALEAVGEDLAAFRDVLQSQRDFRLFLVNPSVLRRHKLELFQRVAGALGLRPLAVTFLRVVLEAERIRLLDGILRAYEGLVDERLGRVRATVTAPGPLDAATEEALRARLGELAGKRVCLEVRQDPAILGGLIARMGSRVYDGSLRTQLRKLNEQLARG